MASALCAGVTAEGGLLGGVPQSMGLTSGSFGGDLAGGLVAAAVDRELSEAAITVSDAYVVGSAAVDAMGMGRPLRET